MFETDLETPATETKTPYNPTLTALPPGKANSLVSSLLPVIEMFMECKLGCYAEAASSAVAASVTQADNGLEELQDIYHAYDRQHPLVQNAFYETIILLRAIGINQPDEQAVETSVKAAIHDMAFAFISA